MATVKTTTKKTSKTAEKTASALSATPVDSTAPAMLTINGKEYVIQNLPAEVQEMIRIYQTWEQELVKQRLEVFKLEAAMKGVGFEIEHRLAALPQE